LTAYLPKQKAASPHTIKSYKHTLNLLIDYTKEVMDVPIMKIDFGTLTRNHLENFLDWLETTRGCNVPTRNQRLAALKSFYTYASNRDIAVVSYAQEIYKIPVKQSEKINGLRYFSEDVLKLLLEQPDTSNKREMRNLFFMILLYDTGARKQEILDLRLNDVHITSKEPYVTLTGKGQKTRLVPIMAKTVDHYKKYISVFHPSNSEDSFLFYTVRKGEKLAMSPDNVEKFIRKYGKAARIQNKEVPEKLHPHMFRHSRAMHLYRNGMPLPLLSEWLGHAQLETTMIYAHADTKMKREAIEKATSELNPSRTTSVPTIDWNDDDTMKKLYGLA
jgi:site-specific recombinase XerD